MHLLKAKQLAWGVQFEIARLVSKGYLAPKDISSEKLEQLRGSNVDAAARVAQVFADNVVDSSALDQAFAKEVAASVRLLILFMMLVHESIVALGRA